MIPDAADARVVRRLAWPPAVPETPTTAREWLVTNGLGGYAFGTVEGTLTRRFHGLLIAALPAPLGRVLMLSTVSQEIDLTRDDGRHDTLVVGGSGHADLPLREFALEWGLPVWRYGTDAVALERRVWMPYGQNTVHIAYRLVRAPGPVSLILRPQLQFRHHEALFSDTPTVPYALHVVEDRFTVSAGDDRPVLHLAIDGAAPLFTVDPAKRPDVGYAMEADRGYDASGTLFSPGAFHITLVPDRLTTLVASVEPWAMSRALPSEESQQSEIERRRQLVAQAPLAASIPMGPELVLAADQFLVLPAGRAEDHVRARAVGDDARTVIAGYPWFTDWGRDTMISLEGLTLLTGRVAEAGAILRTFAHYVRDGLVPNLFPEGEREGLYHTADASLWMFHALDAYVRISNDELTLRRLVPTMIDIVEHHVQGTRFGIGVDPADQLLRQGAEGYQLTWMDAKVGDWVVTPRRGKAVEINALWYNALRVLAGWLERFGPHEGAGRYHERADAVARAFNERFWYDAGGYLYDVVDGEHGDDPACRPNQLFAISLPNPVLDRRRWRAVVDTASRVLVTPVGLRTLSPDHPDYHPRYDGDLRARDAAYHQGTGWAWLAGPFVDAWLRVYPGDLEGARRSLAGLYAHLDEACIGTISETFDAERPFLPRGCVAQAWSVAELLRVSMRVGAESGTAKTSAVS